MTDASLIALYERELAAQDISAPDGYKDDPEPMQIAKLDDALRKGQ